MAFGAETALENSKIPISADRQLLINFESGNRCGFTNICRDNCVLNARAVPIAQEMSDKDKHEALKELILYGENIRHLAIVGKEPLADADLLLDYMLPLYHSTHPQQRPGTVGMITSGLGLQKEVQRFIDRPLTWMILSLDTLETGLRKPEVSWKYLRDAYRLRELRGVGQLGVNSLLTAGNSDSLIKLGQRLVEFELDQWSISLMVRPHEYAMKTICSPSQIKLFLNRISEVFSGCNMEIILDADIETFAALIGEDRANAICPDKWRLDEKYFGSNIVVAALNPREGFFARCRWDGQISAKSEFTTIGLKTGRYGKYSQGQFRDLLTKLKIVQAQYINSSKVKLCVD